MKATFLLVVLAALASGYYAAELDLVEARANLNVGTQVPGDRLLGSERVQRAAIPNAMQQQQVVFSGPFRINAIRVNEVGATQNATPRIISGGIGASHVTIMIQTAMGRGLDYLVEIYGR